MTCSRCISGYLGLYLAGNKGIKSTNKIAYIMAANARSTYTRNTSIR